MNFQKNIFKLIYAGLLALAFLFIFLPIFKVGIEGYYENKNFISLLMDFIKGFKEIGKADDVESFITGNSLLLIVGYAIAGLFIIIMPLVIIVVGFVYLIVSIILPMFIPSMAEKYHNKMAKLDEKKRKRSLNNKYFAFGYVFVLALTLLLSKSYVS